MVHFQWLFFNCLIVDLREKCPLLSKIEIEITTGNIQRDVEKRIFVKNAGRKLQWTHTLIVTL